MFIWRAAFGDAAQQHHLQYATKKMLRRHLVPSLRKTTLVKSRQTFDLCIAQFGHGVRERCRKQQFFACRVELLELPGTFSIGRISEIVLSFQKLTDNAVHDDHVICTDFLADDSGRITGNLELDPKRLIGR